MKFSLSWQRIWKLADVYFDSCFINRIYRINKDCDLIELLTDTLFEECIVARHQYEEEVATILKTNVLIWKI